MAQITIKELAGRLKLSISTVSRALGDSYEVSAETRDKVRALAEKLNYKPNPYASNLRSRKSNTIAVIIPEISNLFFALAIDGIEEIARQNGYHVLIYLSHDDYEKEAGMVQHLLNGRVDGILMSVASETKDISHIEELKKNKIPLIFFDRICDAFKTVKVVTDDFNSGYKATHHLASNGCRNIAYLSLSRNLSIDQKRMDGYLRACHDMGLQNQVILCSQHDQENEKKLSGLFLSPNCPDGIFASVEKLAMNTYEVCNKLAIPIPSKIKVISFSNLKIASLLNPPLTTITQPAFEIGKQAAIALFKCLKNNSAFQHNEEIIIPSVLVQRGSTALTENP